MTQCEMRLKNANRLLQTISEYGRRFFRRSDNDRVSHFLIAANGRLYYCDKHSAQKLPMSNTKSSRWGRYFSEGGTLKALVEGMGHYIKTGESLGPGHLGPWPKWYCDGDPWGYGDDMVKVRVAATALDIITQEPTS